jgi:hypothetical protein
MLGPNFWVAYTPLAHPDSSMLPLLVAASALKILFLGDFVSSTCPQPMPFFPLWHLIEVLVNPVPVYIYFGTIMPTSQGHCTRLYFQFKPFNFSSSNLFMGLSDPPPNVLATHLVPQIMPRPVSSAPVGFIDDNGTAFLSQYLARPVPLPDTAPSLLMQSCCVPYG